MLGEGAMTGALWDYLGDRLMVPDAPAVRYLPDPG